MASPMRRKDSGLLWLLEFAFDGKPLKEPLGPEGGEMGVDLVAPAVREFQQRHAMSKVSLFDLHLSAQIDRLRQQELDAAILGNIDHHERAHFAVKFLSHHRFAAGLPESHPMAARKSIKLSG